MVFGAMVRTERDPYSWAERILLASPYDIALEVLCQVGGIFTLNGRILSRLGGLNLQMVLWEKWTETIAISRGELPICSDRVTVTCDNPASYTDPALVLLAHCDARSNRLVRPADVVGVDDCQYLYTL